MSHLKESNRYIFAYKLLTVNNKSECEVVFIDIVPKEIDISFVKTFINKIYDTFEVGQYIQKMIWDKPATITPSLYFPKVPDDKFDLMHKLHNEICEILAKLWDLKGGTPASEIPIDM